MSRCVIIGSGPYKNPHKLEQLISPDDMIIVADGGWKLAMETNLKPSKLVADFDSFSNPMIPEDVNVVTLPEKKDDTDTAVALREGFESGYRAFLLLGCTGGRLDHYYAALTIAAQYAQKDCDVVIVDEQNEIRVLAPGEYVFSATIGQTVSMFAFGGDVTDLSADCLEYELNHFTLSPMDPLCVSNKAVGCDVRISFASGVLLLHFSKD